MNVTFSLETSINKHRRICSSIKNSFDLISCTKNISCHAHLESVFLWWSPSIHTNLPIDPTSSLYQVNRSIPFKHNRTLPLHPHHNIMRPLNTVYAYFLLHHLEVYWHDLTCIQKQSPFTIWWILFTRQTFHLLTLNDQVIHDACVTSWYKEYIFSSKSSTAMRISSPVLGLWSLMQFSSPRYFHHIITSFIR